MSLFQVASRRLVSPVSRALKPPSAKKQQLCLEMARPSSSKTRVCLPRSPEQMTIKQKLDLKL